MLSSAAMCIHNTEKGIITTDSGITIANVCAYCGEVVSDIGYVDTSSAISVYKDSKRTVAYTEAELLSGFSNAVGDALYVENGVVSQNGEPYWITADMVINALPVINEGDSEADLSATSFRAYKGWSIVGIVHKDGSTYDSALRLIPDGWEVDSGAIGTSKGTTDGFASIKFCGDNESFREQETVVDIKAGDKVRFALRVEPATGEYDVYVNNIFAGSAKMPVRAEDKTPYVRFSEWGITDFGAHIDVCNISIFKDIYTTAAHTHDYTNIIEFYDEGVCRYKCCACGEKMPLDSENIVAVAADGLQNVYDGFGNFNINSDKYWFVTDINIRGTIEDGNLLSFGAECILEIKDGRFVSGGKAAGGITWPCTYQVAVEISDGEYKLYLNGIYTAYGSLDNVNEITCGDTGFGHHIRFLYNKAVALGDAQAPVVPTYGNECASGACFHSDDGIKANAKTLVHTAQGVKYIYQCVVCGERVYSDLKKDLTNSANDVAYKYYAGAIMRNELEGFTANMARNLYLENNIIGNTALPYWVTFDVTPETLPSNEKGDLADPNSRVYKGYSLVSIDAAYLPASELRVIPDGWEKENANGTVKGATDGRCEVKVINESSVDYIALDTLGYRNAETVAYLEVGVTTSFALYVDPMTGAYDVYVDGVYKASAKKLPISERSPKIVFHDNGMGEFLYSNISVSDRTYNFDGKIVAIEANVTFEAVATSASNVYTSLISLEQNNEKYNLFYVNNKNGSLEFKDKNGNFNTLYDDKGNVVYLDETRSVSAVYDDINGDVRYYVGGKLAKYKNGENLVWANEISVYDSDFVSAGNKYYSLRFNSEKVANLNIIGLGATDTAEVVGFQPNDLNDSIRLLSGLDSLYYGAVGYEVQAYKPNGEVYKDVSATKSTNSIYSSVVADGIKLPASKYGYNYFSALKISGNYFGYKDSYIIVKPFTKIGDKTYYGESVRLNILDNGRYEFAENN